MRERIYSKLLDLGASYNSLLKTSEIVQVAVEGVDQLETYFGPLPNLDELCCNPKTTVGDLLDFLCKAKS